MLRSGLDAQAHRVTHKQIAPVSSTNYELEQKYQICNEGKCAFLPPREKRR